MSSRSFGVWVAFVFGAATSGCAVSTDAGAPPEPATESSDQALLGASSFAAGCNTTQRAFIERFLAIGRAAATTRAFEQCVDKAMRVGVPNASPRYGDAGPYRACSNDPFFGQPITVQRDAALDVARSVNGVRMDCGSDPSYNGSTFWPWPGYDHSDNEEFTWGSFLEAQRARIALPICTGAPGPGCRVDSNATIFAWLNNTVWHEAMHEHAYKHDDRCDGAAWSPSVESVPWIVGHCAEYVIAQSGQTCGDVESCGPGRAKLVTGLGASTCECVADPRGGVVSRPSNSFMHVTSAANTSGYITTLDHPLLNNNRLAVVHFTHVWNPNGGSTAAYNGNKPIAWYNNSTGRWVISNTNYASMPLGTGFAVRVGRGVVHRTSASNISGHLTTISHELADGDFGAFVTASPTPYANAWSGVVNPHATGVYFDPGSSRWTVFNQDIAPMPENTAFTIEVESPTQRGLFFKHRTTAANTFANSTTLDHPHLNGRPSAKLLVTPNWSHGTVYNTADVGVWYDGSRWNIYTESGSGSGAAMPIGTGFNVEVLRDEDQRWVPVPEFSSGVDTGLDVSPGDRVAVRASGKIWSGWIASPDVGPEGESSFPDNSSFPLNTNRFSLIGRMGSGPWMAIGRTNTLAGPAFGTQRLILRTNDDVPGNGSGFFSASARVFR